MAVSRKTLALQRRLLIALLLVAGVTLASATSLVLWPGNGTLSQRLLQGIELAGLLALVGLTAWLYYATNREHEPSSRQTGRSTPEEAQASYGLSYSQSQPVGVSLELLQTVLAGFAKEPDSPQPFLPVLREIDATFGAECCAVFLLSDTADGPQPLACTAEGEHLATLVSDELFAPATSAQGTNQILEYPPRTEARLIAVRLRAMAETNGGLLVIKTKRVTGLSGAEQALLETLADGLAGIIDSVRQAESNKRRALSAERAVIARELHDSLAQSLSYLKIQTSRLERLLQGAQSNSQLDQHNADAVLQELRTQLQIAYHQLREIITTFRLTMNGRTLRQALSDCIEEFESRSGIAFSLDDRLRDDELSIDEEIQVLQIVRECMSNIVRHAHASRGEVSLQSASNRKIQITVDDDGIGMERAPPQARHHGLVIMQQRAHALGGDMRVKGSPQNGTHVEVTFATRGREAPNAPQAVDSERSLQPTAVSL